MLLEVLLLAKLSNIEIWLFIVEDKILVQCPLEILEACPHDFFCFFLDYLLVIIRLESEILWDLDVPYVTFSLLGTPHGTLSFPIHFLYLIGMKSLTSNLRIVLYLVKAIGGESGSPNSSNSVMCQCVFLPTGIFDMPRLDLTFLLPKPSGSSAGGGSYWRHKVIYDPLN